MSFAYGAAEGLTRKLPVFSAAREVYAGVIRHFWDLLRAAWIPVLLVVAVRSYAEFRFAQFAPPSGLDSTPDEVMRAYFMTILPTFLEIGIFLWVGWAMMAVAFHRFVLIGEKTRGLGGTGLIFGRKELLYFWSALKIFVIWALSAPVLSIPILVGSIYAYDRLYHPDWNTFDAWIMPAAVLADVIGWVVLVPLVLRAALVLPHVSLGGESNIRYIWRRAEGNTWRLLVLMLLVTMLPALLFFAIAFISAPVPLAATALGAVAYVILGMLSTTALSVAYREIVGLPSDTVPVVRAASEDIQPA
ncbi:hypothetical protein [Parvibaculum sp.]|uniref:hypothetical protein n=1 Tax=Parvibaculum sp. TaxID=2024848 RepID=UPI002B81251C|nr:hypothetical protein [Parvibaculum sp.]HUD50501.1 hypothetical protein [Parvibaculum sp.]